MATRINRQGLGRDIPADVRREVRRRSKFGCVICRNGFYEYEHIIPFAEIRRHDPDHICCLCEQCHGRITRGQWSKDRVRASYTAIQQQTSEEAGPPAGPLDFHSGDAVLAFGDLVYAPAVQTVLRFYGDNLIQLSPGADGDPGAISAVFTDDDGNCVLELEENEWVGSLDAWDIEVVGPRISVRKRLGVIALQLRLDPPGRVVVERLDMRIGAHHILASDQSYAVGAYFEDGDLGWVSPHVMVTASAPHGAAIEMADLDELLQRDRTGRGARLATPDGNFIMHGGVGVLVPALEVSIASGCNFRLMSSTLGRRSLQEMREAVFHLPPPEMRRFLGTGR